MDAVIFSKRGGQSTRRVHKSMKKTAIILLTATLLVSSLSAYSNRERIISVDSPVWKAMETLYIISGRSLPSSSGPWSEDEMTMMLERIDYPSLDEAGKRLYDYIYGIVVSEPKKEYSDNLALSFGLEANLEGYLHTDKEGVVDEKDWFHGFTSRRPLLNLTFEAWPLDSFYGYFELTLQNNYGYDVGRGKSSKNALYNNTFNTNIPYVNALLFSKPSNGNAFADFDWTFPYKALVSAGGSHWNAAAGRDRLSWGSGETGNLMLSSSFPRQTFLRFNTYFNAFKYSIVFSVYPGVDAVESQYKSLAGWKSLVTHRLEFTLFDGRVGLVVNEACMYWSSESKPGFTLAQINPFGFMHNEYTAGNANSLLVFEADYTPLKGINIYGQFAVDEFSGPGEGRTNPSAFGVLAGVKGALTLGGGILYGSLEFARTDPFLYIRGLHYSEEKDDSRGYGFNALLRTVSCDRIILQNKFVTYTYGNDVILFDGRINYSVPGSFRLSFEAAFIEHGSMNADSCWGMYRDMYENAPDVKTPTTFNPFDPDDYDAATGTVKSDKEVEKSIILSLGGEYDIRSNLRVYATADCVIVRNKDNVKGRKTTDFQISFGVGYTL